MLTKSEATDLAFKQIQKITSADDHVVIIDSVTIEKPYGWVFFYDTKIFLETGDFRYRLLGNGPVVVNKYDQSVEVLGTCKPPSEFIREYEMKLSRWQKGE